MPGLGNINELPNLPIQVSDLTSVRYPEAADLGDALVANAYALLKTYKNVDILFETEISQREFNNLALNTKGGDLDFKVTLTIFPLEESTLIFFQYIRS